MCHPRVGALIVALAAFAAFPATALAKVPASVMEKSGDTTYSLQSNDVDNTSGGSALLTLSPMRNGLVKVSEAGSAAYQDVKKLQNGQSVAGVGGFAVGNIQPDGTIKVIPAGPTVRYLNIIIGLLNAGPDTPKKGDAWKADVEIAGATGQGIVHFAVTASVINVSKQATTISFDGNGDDTPIHGFMMPKIHLKTHTFGTISIAGKELQTAEGETDSTVAQHGHNEKWSLKRG